MVREQEFYGLNQNKDLVGDFPVRLQKKKKKWVLQGVLAHPSFPQAVLHVVTRHPAVLSILTHGDASKRRDPCHTDEEGKKEPALPL